MTWIIFAVTLIVYVCTAWAWDTAHTADGTSFGVFSRLFICILGACFDLGWIFSESFGRNCFLLGVGFGVIGFVVLLIREIRGDSIEWPFKGEIQDMFRT